MYPSKDYSKGVKKKAVICLGAGKSQVPVIKAAKGMGFAVLAVDRNVNAPGFSLSDGKINLSTHHAEPMIKALEEFRKRYEIKGILNRSSGPPVETAAVLCQFLSLPGVNPEAARTIVDKSKLMAFCRDKNIPSPLCVSGKDLSEMDLTGLGFPMVVKPALSAVGKSGVTAVPSIEALPEAFLHAQKASLNGIINLEEQVGGRDVALMSVIQNGSLYPITLLDELNIHDSVKHIRGFGFAVPSVFTDTPVYGKILHLAQQIALAFDLQSSAFIMSCRCDESHDPKLIEIHLDMGGDLILDSLLPASTPFDVLNYMCEMLTNREPRKMEAIFEPRAVLFSKGEGLVTDREYRILSGKNREDLEKSISRLKKEKNA